MYLLQPLHSEVLPLIAAPATAVAAPTPPPPPPLLLPTFPPLLTLVRYLLIAWLLRTEADAIEPTA
jgi:hypothetical protein